MAGDIKVAVVSGAISSSGTGTADFTKAGFGTPKACIILLSFDTVDDTSVAAEGKASIGFSDFTNHRCITHQDEDVSAKVDNDCRKSPTKAYVLLDVAGAVDIDGTVSTITEGVRLTNTTNGSASAVFVTVIMFGGADLEVSLDSIVTPNLIDGTQVVTTGIDQDLVFFIGVDIAGEDSSSTGINNSFGVAHIRKSDHAAFVNRCMGWASDHNNNVGSPSSVIRNDRCLKILTETSIDDWGIELTAATTTSYTITERDVISGNGMEIYALALNLDNRGSKVGSVDSPFSGATWTPSVALGFTPQYVGLGLTRAEVEGTIETDADAGALGISSNTGVGEEACHSWYNEDASVAANTNNNFRSRVIDLRNDDVTIVIHDHSHSSFNDGDWTYILNIENEGTTRKWFYWAIEEAIESTLIDVPVGVLNLTGLVPSAIENTIINIPVATLGLTGFVPTILTPVTECLLLEDGTGILLLEDGTGCLLLESGNVFIEVPKGTLTLTGLVPSVKESTDISIPLSSVALIGFVPSALENTIINVPVASLSITGFAITVIEGEIINIPVASITLTGFVVTLDEAISIPLGTLALTGFAPAALESTVINIPVSSLALTGFVPIVIESTLVNVPVASLVLTGLVPAALENDIINIPVGTKTLTGFAVGFQVDIPVASLALTGFAPTVREGVNINIPVGSLALTGFITTHDIGIDISVASLILTSFIPVIVESTEIEVPVASLVLTGFVPVASVDLTIIIPVGSLTLTGLGVTLDIGIEIPVGALVLSGFVPSILESTTVNIPTGSLILTGFTLTLNESIIIPVGSLVLTGFVPIVEVGGGQTIEIPAGSLALTGFAITILREIPVPQGSLVLTGFVPVINLIVDIPVSALFLSGRQPFIIFNEIVNIPAGNLTLAGFIPVAVETENDVTVIVPVASLTLTGFSPLALESGDDGVIVPVGKLTLISFAPNVIVTLFNIETCDMDIIFPKDVDKLIIPVLQSIEFNLDRLKNINLPDSVIVDDIGEFQALEPVSPAKEVERITFLYADFALTVQNVIDGKIGELIAEVKPYNVEMIEWGREKEDLLEDSEESVESSFDGEASRGFVAPSGVFSKDISRQSIKLKKNISRANEVFFSGQNAATLQNMTDGLQAGNQAEVIVRNTDKERQTINLQAVQNLVEIDFRIFEIYLQRHNSSIEIKRIKHQAWLEEIRAQLLILQEREIAIKGFTLNLQERAKQVEMFNIAIDYLNAKQALKEIDLENFIIQAETERNKLLKFQAEVDKFSALINLNIAKFNLYKAGIDFEESKVDRFREEAAVAGAQLDVQNARTTAGRIESDTKIDIANAKLQAQLEKLRAARSRLDTALSTGRARIVNFSGDLLNYQAELRDWLTENTDELLENITQKESQRDLDVTGLRDLSRQDVNVIQFNTEAQNIADLGNLNSEVISQSADITAKTEITSKLIHSLVGG